MFDANNLSCPSLKFSVMVRSVCGISRLVTGPLVALLEKSAKDMKLSNIQLQEEAAYLKNLLKEKNVDVSWIKNVILYVLFDKTFTGTRTIQKN